MASSGRRRRRSSNDAPARRRRSERGSRGASTGRSTRHSSGAGRTTRAHNMMEASPGEERGDTEAVDTRAIAAILDNKVTLDKWESAWLCFLSHGAPLEKNASNFLAFRAWCRECKITTCPSIDQNQADIDAAMVTSVVEDVLDQRMIGEDLPQADIIDFRAFIRALCLIGFHKYGMERTTKDSHEVVLGGLLQDYVEPWVERHRARYDTDGIKPVAEGLHCEEVDRLLYVYHSPLHRIFHKFVGDDPEGAARLAGGQTTIPSPQYRSLMGFDRFRETLAELGVEVAASAMGQILELAVESNEGVDGLPVKAARQPSVDPPSQDEALEKEKEGSTGGDDDAGSGDAADMVHEDSAVPSAQNPYEHLLVDVAGFVEALLRMSQFIATRTEHDKKTIPTIAARFQAFLARLRSRYESFFGHSIDEDCDWTPKGLPLLATKGALPSSGPPSVDASYDITINGSNFCTKRGVYVRFESPHGHEVGTPPPVVKAHTVLPQRVIVTVPPVDPLEVVVDAFCDQGTQVWCVDVARNAVCHLEASNDGHAWTATAPKLAFTFVDKLPSWFLPEEVANDLHTTFTKIVTFRDKRNTRYMTLEKWRRFKADYNVDEAPLPGALTTQQLTHTIVQSLKSSATTAAMATNEEPYFRQLSSMQVLPPLSTDTENHGVRSEACLDLKAFLKILCMCLCVDPEKEGGEAFEPPGQRIAQLLAVAVEKEAKRVEISVDDILDELNTTREAIAMIEHKTTRVLDVYLGSVLCANIVDHPGSIAMSNDSAPKKKHKALTCTIYDTSNEGVIASHVMLCDTFDQLYHRLANASFDFASPNDPATRKPTGRCWQVFNNETKVGVVWDYPGNFSNHLWQPTQLDAYNKKLTMTVYKDHEDLDFIVPFMQYMKADTPQKIRKLLVQRGYTLRSCLYKKV
eukprot:TRINITY_DN22591_c0_g1_i1.p1 TRINITY_DN22591_c0_g1~~TRINITY_DN22591_c0_g1_i1.p1  ORF type:complete len:944 (+),score=306.61 TRINITY_DN22591_c0_g1_i1:82-2832(+)